MSASAAETTETVSIETKTEFEEQVKTTGVVVDGVLHHTEGEGRGTRYFVGDENVAKDEVVGGYGGEGEYEIPADESGGDGDEDEDGVDCLVCGDNLGLITGSHLQTHEEDEPQTVDEYIEYALDQQDLDAGEVDRADIISSEETKEKMVEEGRRGAEESDFDFSRHNKRRWDDGEYEHLRDPRPEDGEAEDDEE